MRRLCTFILLLALFPSLIAETRKPVTNHKCVRASFYADKFEGHLMSNGEPFHGYVMSAASRSYPLGTILYVTSVKTGESIFVEVTDRGPWGTRYGLDLSRAAFESLGLDTRDGWGWVKVERAYR